ncbi:thiamine pyrophosphate-binding protein [Tropicimonas sp. S265A]|uniref:thiamine pyrophosphate-binding protein n=1 Tax=Tropicimonas sp. S265A TaxID=3415134 RepID=UPI003C7B8C7D
MTLMETVAQLFARSLAAGGIDTVYAMPGEETIALMNALEKSPIDVILCRHEQGAAFMASVHGRLTGRPAACLATLGPGATNLITGVADAQLDGVPLIAITGQGARERVARGRDSHQIIDLTALFEPVTKRSETLYTCHVIPGVVAEALRIAQAPTPGAVHLSLPEDLAELEATGEPIIHDRSFTPSCNPGAVSAAVDCIQRADRALALVGAGVIRAGATGDLTQFLTCAQIPVATSFMGKGTVPIEHELHLGAFGLPGKDHVDQAIASADVLVAIGVDPVEYPFTKLSGGNTPVVNVSDVAMPRNLGAPVAVDVVGHIGASLSELGKNLAPEGQALWDEAQTAQLRMLDEQNAALNAIEVQPPSASALVAALNLSVGEDDLILSGVGTHKLALAREFMCRFPRQLIVPNGLAGMGLALPGAIAAARLRQSGRVIAVCGDGDVLMNVQEMETAKRLGVDLTVVVWVDGGLGLIEDKQEADTGDRPNLSFHDLDWASLARTFGWAHRACTTAAELRDTLKDTAMSRGLHLVTVPVRYEGLYA